MDDGWQVRSRGASERAHAGHAGGGREPWAEITLRLYSLVPGDAEVTIGFGDELAQRRAEHPGEVLDEVGGRAQVELAAALEALRE